MEPTQVAEQAAQESVSSLHADSTNTKKRKQRNTLIVVGALGAAVCLCMGICVIAGGWRTITGSRKAALDLDEITAVIDEFMVEMEQGNAEAAYALFSARARNQFPLSDLLEMLQGDSYALFEGYESVEVTTWTLQAPFYRFGPEPPEGKSVNFRGAVKYEGGITGEVTAVLAEEGDTWRLFQIKVIVPPSKLTSP